MMKTGSLFVVVLLSAVVADEYDPNYPAAYFVLDGESVDLPCNVTDEKYQLHESVVLVWTRHEVEIIANSAKYNFTAAMGIDNLTLTVNNVQPDDYGFYDCHVYNGTELSFTTRIGINTYGPVIKDLREKYHTPIVIGAVAAAILLGVLLIIAFVYRFRYKKNSDKSYVIKHDLYTTDLSKVNSSAFDNPAVEVYDHNTKADIEMKETTAANGKDDGIHHTYIE